MTDLAMLLQRLAAPRILVVQDLILDRSVWDDAERVNPEMPLFVAINRDASVRRLKGPSRPIVNQESRTALLSALACVDHVLIFDDDTPHAVLRQIRPDVLVKGGTYRVDEVVGRELVMAYGGRVCVVAAVDGVSTTGILQKAACIERSQS